MQHVGEWMRELGMRTQNRLRTRVCDVVCLIRLQHHVSCAQECARVEAPDVQLVEVEDARDASEAILELLDVCNVRADVQRRLRGAEPRVGRCEGPRVSVASSDVNPKP